MRIEKIDPSGFESVVSLFARVVEGMRADGIDQWDEIYPDRAVLEADVRAGAGYALFGGGVDGRPFPVSDPVGYIALNGDQPEEYRDVPWRETGGTPMVIHRLCVDPLFRGRGAAKTLLAFAETYARNVGHTSIRLDAFSLNPKALALYGTRGYEKRGQVRFRKGAFDCFEKILKAGDGR